jgi:hypothetical protein
MVSLKTLNHHLPPMFKHSKQLIMQAQSMLNINEVLSSKSITSPEQVNILNLAQELNELGMVAKDTHVDLSSLKK